jgi:hypothetical protein
MISHKLYQAHVAAIVTLLASFVVCSQAHATRKSRYSIDPGRRHAGRCQVANGELANRDERQAQSPLCRCPRPYRRWTTAADQG